MTTTDATPRHIYPYQLGVLLSVNAIRDTALVIDGPECIVRKARHVHGRHDWSSTLLDCGGASRVLHTDVNAEAVIQYTGDALLRTVARAAETLTPGAVLVTAMPHVELLGLQRKALLADIAAEHPCPLIDIPAGTGTDDWLDGYSAVLDALAEHLVLPRTPLDPNRVALIGNLLDRTERDHLANVAELRRLARGLGLELESVWLSGGTIRELTAAGRAATLVSLPRGRRAARLLAARTGATVVEADLPFGAQATISFLQTLGEATGRASAAQAFVEAELGRLTPRLQWAIYDVFAGRRVAFGGPPEQWPGLVDIADELAVETALLTAPCAPHHAPPPPVSALTRGEIPTLLGPSRRQMHEALRALPRGALDLALSGGDQGHQFAELGVPVLEFGFPSLRSHAMWDRPFLGFEGWLCFVDRLAEALCSASPREDLAES